MFKYPKRTRFQVLFAVHLTCFLITWSNSCHSGWSNHGPLIPCRPCTIFRSRCCLGPRFLDLRSCRLKLTILICHFQILVKNEFPRILFGIFRFHLRHLSRVALKSFASPTDYCSACSHIGVGKPQ